MLCNRFQWRKWLLSLCIVLIVLSFLNFSQIAEVSAASLHGSHLQTTPEHLCIISSPDITYFPEVSVKVRIIGSNWQANSEISSADLMVQENNSPAVPVTLSGETSGVGLNMLFLYDSGNRTNQSLVYNTLRAFPTYLRDSVDEFAIYNDDSNAATTLLSATDSLVRYNQIVDEISTERSSSYNVINTAIEKALLDMNAKGYECAHPNMIVLVAGGGILQNSDQAVEDYILLANGGQIRFVVFHLLGPDGTFSSQSEYERLAEGTFGDYFQIRTDDDINAALNELKLEEQRFTYRISYRSNNGDDGEHRVTLLYQTQDITSVPASYAITLMPPSVVIHSPVDQARLTGDLVVVDFSIGWPDGYIRDIDNMSFIVQSPDGVRTVSSQATGSSGGGTLNISWDISDTTQWGNIPYTFTVQVTDELGLTNTSAPVNVRLRNVSLVWTFVIVIGAIIIAFVVLFFILVWYFKQNLGDLVKKGGMGKFAKEVRKTLVGGFKRGKALAKLDVMEGPPNLIGQSLPIFTTSVKLGRDPEVADLTFFTPETQSSVSGLHCRIEQAGGTWRVVALSKSGNETFVDNESVPFHEPYPLRDGQQIRMGYPAQQSVLLKFHVGASSSTPPRTTDVGPRRTEVEKETPSLKKVEKKGPKQEISPEPVDDKVFDEFRDRE